MLAAQHLKSLLCSLCTPPPPSLRHTALLWYHHSMCVPCVQGDSKQSIIWGGQRGKKSMTPYRGNTVLFCSSWQLSRLCLGPLKSFLSWHDTLQGPSTYLVRSFQNKRIKDTVRYVALSAEVPGQRYKQLTQTLIVRLLRTHFTWLICWNSQKSLEVQK